MLLSMSNVIHALGYLLALVLYAILITSRSHESAKCRCIDRPQSFSYNNCIDEAGWLLHSNHTVRPITTLPPPTSNSTVQSATSRHPHTRRRARRDYRFYGVAHGKGEPVDREIYLSFFADDARGFYVQVGGDFEYSPTRFFAESLGWDGLLVGQGKMGKRDGERVSGGLKQALSKRGVGVVDLLLLNEDADWGDVLVRVALVKDKFREIVAKGGLCFVSKNGEYEVWTGDEVFKRRFCGWEMVAVAS